MTKQTAVRIPDETFERLQVLAKSTGRTTTFYIREAIQAHLENLEDIYFSEAAVENLRKGQDSVLDSKVFWDALGN